MEEVGEVENNLVSKVIVCYLGIDIFVEGCLVKNWKGIVIIIYGIFLLGKLVIVVSMVKYYNVVCLSIDFIVLEVVFDSNNVLGIWVCEFCIRVVIE